MSFEDELIRLARASETRLDGNFAAMDLDAPGTLRKQIRAYLANLADRRILTRSNGNIPRLNAGADHIQQLACPEIEFTSGSTLTFDVKLEENHGRWSVKQFRFDLRLLGRSVEMASVHLNLDTSHEPHRVPRCHLHIRPSRVHIPFPASDPRLIVNLMCEHIEPDLGLDPAE